MRTSRLLLGCATALVMASICTAGIRHAGKYAGVVIFDRWDGCTLYSGVYVMYVSEAVKQQLRGSAGQCVQIDATKVAQPRNPGDGLIQALTLLGPAPDGPAWQSTAGLGVSVKPTFTNGHPPTFVVRVKNGGKEPATLWMDALAPTLLAKRGPHDWGPADGPSTAVVTRQAFWVDGPRLTGSNETWQWSVTSPATFQRDVTLRPKDAFEIALSFKLPAGEYDFLAGYGGGVQDGRCVASNLVGFDVDGYGLATLAAVAKR